MNIKKFYLYWIFKDLIPIYPLYLLMFQNHGLSVAQISLLLAIWSVPCVIFEIPTGILADRWSRKKLIVIGGLFKALCYLIWMNSGHFTLYALGFILWGTGGALRSGSEEALLYDSLKLIGRENKFDKVYGRGRFLSGVSNILAAVSGGFIGMQFGFQAALGLSVISALITSAISLSMEEVNLYKKQLHLSELNGKETTLRKAFSFLIRNKELLLFVLLALLVISTSGILDEYDQLIAKGYGLSIKLIGIWTAIRFILMAFGGIAARGLRIMVEKLFHLKDRMYSISALCVMAAVFLILSGFIRQIGIMIFYGLYYFLLSAGEVLQEDYVQQRIDSEGRSTVHSLISLSQNLYGILCYGLFGAAVSISGVFPGLVWCGVYIALWTFLIAGIYTVYMNKQSIGKEAVR